MSEKLATIKQLEAAFSRDLRLLSSKDYAAVFNNRPIKLVCPSFTLLATPNKVSHARIGLIVAKKNVRFAVERNRIKRLARETFRLNKHTLPHYDYVLLARHGSSKLLNKVLSEHLEQLWSRARKKCVGY